MAYVSQDRRLQCRVAQDFHEACRWPYCIWSTASRVSCRLHGRDPPTSACPSLSSLNSRRLHICHPEPPIDCRTPPLNKASACPLEAAAGRLLQPMPRLAAYEPSFNLDHADNMSSSIPQRSMIGDSADVLALFHHTGPAYICIWYSMHPRAYAL